MLLMLRWLLLLCAGMNDVKVALTTDVVVLTTEQKLKQLNLISVFMDLKSEYTQLLKKIIKDECLPSAIDDFAERLTELYRLHPELCTDPLTSGWMCQCLK